MRIGAWILLLLVAAGPAWGYPLDGEPRTGIQRLLGTQRIQEGKAPGPRLPTGALLPDASIGLRLLTSPDLAVGTADSALSEQMSQLLGEEAGRYGLALLDLSDPERPVYATHQADMRLNPGSVGKLVVALALFQVLADLYPDDVAARESILRETRVTADDFILSDEHDVPFWHPEKGRMFYRPLRRGDTANLWSWLDWMLSASSNAAASMVLKQVMLLAHFGRSYPVADAVANDFYKTTRKKDLGRLLRRVLDEPVARNGLDLEHLRQGGFFTRRAKQIVPGGGSRVSAGELVNFLLHLEQGKLVDPFSSLEMKRLLYLTRRRIRYASHPALSGAAIYFKSGSLYRCREEEGFVCGKYRGNVDNMMNSVAIVEAPAGERRYFYLVAVVSNVLRVNSAAAHQTLAMRLHRLIERYHRQKAAPLSAAEQ